MEKCKFEINGKCYCMVCCNPMLCNCKDSNGIVIRQASLSEIKGTVMPEMVVMQPTVQNVASEENGVGEYDSELGVIITKMDDVNLDYTREDGK